MRANVVANRTPEDSVLVESMLASEGIRNNDPEAVEAFWRVYFRAYFVDPTLADSMDLTFTENPLANSDAVAGFILRSVGAFDLHGQLQALTVPTLTLHGDADPMPLAYARRIHESIPESQLVVAENAGHWIFMEATELFRSSIEGFLSRLR